MTTGTLTKPNGQIQIQTGCASFGTSFISVLVKRSYRIVAGQPALRLEADQPLLPIDLYYDGGEPANATVQFEAEVAPIKAAVDVVIIGKAHAADAAACHEMMVGVSLGSARKRLLITGDRICHHMPAKAPRFSDPQPFVHMPLRYERAYGGKDHRSIDDIPFWYPRNDMGVGVALRNEAGVVDGLRLPNIEDPDDRLVPERVIIGEPNRWHLQPLPQGLGWRQRSWFPRCAWIGSCPPFLDVNTETTEERLGLLPKNYVALARQFRLKPDPARFANGASLGLTVDDLSPRENIRLSGLTADGELQFHLPDDFPVIGLNVGQGMVELDSRLFTVSVRPDDLQLDMIWGGMHSVGDMRNWASVTRLEAEVS